MKLLRVYWPLFVILTPLLLFGGPEAIGIISVAEGDTLSEMTREWLGIVDGKPTARFWVFLTLWTGLAVWFPPHLLSLWPWEKKTGVALLSPSTHPRTASVEGATEIVYGFEQFIRTFNVSGFYDWDGPGDLEFDVWKQHPEKPGHQWLIRQFDLAGHVWERPIQEEES